MSRQKSLSRRLFRRGSVRKPARSYSYKPSLQLLECRALPSTIVVTNLLDSGAGSLRAAITQANSQPGNDTIAVAAGLNGNLILRSALPDLSSNIHIIDIQVPGDAGVTVRRADDSAPFRILMITSGNVVAISGLTISNGHAGFGGGIFNDGGLTLTNCTVSGNLADSGGGIYTSFPMALTNSIVTGNSAYRDGAGILNTSLLKLTTSTVSGNFEAFGGNTSGGGIHNRNTGRLFINNSTVSGNSAGSAGGIANKGELTLTNSTVSSNFGFLVGGIFNAQFGKMTVTNTTVAGNDVYYDSAAIVNVGELILNNSIVANSSIVGNGDGQEVSNHEFGTITGSHNLIEDGSGGLADTISGDPNLGPLANNGGPTQTHALLFGSLAINAGSNTLVPASTTTDQRGPGSARIFSGKADIGAFERQGTPRAFQRGDTLFILGDREANHIAIADTRQGGISVSFDQGTPQTFAGVKQIDLKTFGGDDEMAFFCPADPSNFEFRADLGAGDDRLSISGFDPQPDPPRRRISFDILAGAGNDEIFAICPSDPNILEFRADLGAGNDRLNINWEEPEEAERLDTRRGLVAFDIRAGAGDDEVTVTCPSDPGNFEFRADLGNGNDRLSISGFDPQPDPPLRRVFFDIVAGAGDDQVAFELGHIHFAGRFLISADSGAGNDRLTFGVIQPCILPESELRIEFNGNVGDDHLAARIGGPGDAPAVIAGNARVDLDGGAGDDQAVLNVDNVDIRGTLLADIAGDRGADQLMMSMSTDVDVFGTLALRALGGAGNDVLESFIEPCFLPGGRGRLVFDDDAGDDRISVQVHQHEGDEGALDVRVLGGQGNDDLTLALFGVEHLSFLAALVDGGRGHDVAHVTRNVRVANCDEVFFLDDPR